NTRPLAQTISQPLMMRFNDCCSKTTYTDISKSGAEPVTYVIGRNGLAPKRAKKSPVSQDGPDLAWARRDSSCWRFERNCWIPTLIRSCLAHRWRRNQADRERRAAGLQIHRIPTPILEV